MGRFKGWCTGCVLAALLLCCGGRSVSGQSIWGLNSFFNNLDGLPNAGNASAYTTNVTSGTGNGNNFNTTPGASANPNPPPTFIPGTQVIVSLSGAATENGDATPDTFNFVLRSTEAFNLNQQAAVTIPTFLTGAINFFQNAAPPNANTSVGSVTADVVVLDNTNADRKSTRLNSS